MIRIVDQKELPVLTEYDMVCSSNNELQKFCHATLRKVRGMGKGSIG